MGWHEGLRTDICSIDEEHESLVERVDALPDVVKPGDEQAFLARLDALIEEVTAHFAREERIMRNIGLPDLHRHIALHHSLLWEIRDVRQQMARSLDANTPQAVKGYLRYWLMHHVSAEDIRIRQHLHRDPAADRRQAS